MVQNRHKRNNIIKFSQYYHQSFEDLQNRRQHISNILDFYKHEYERGEVIKKYGNKELQDIKSRIIDSVTTAIDKKAKALLTNINNLKNRYEDFTGKLDEVYSIESYIASVEDAQYSVDELINFLYIKNQINES